MQDHDRRGGDVGLYSQLAPGALVHARVGLWKPRQTTVWLVQPAAVARPLADPGLPFDPRASGLTGRGRTVSF